jgi:tetratricopeptide (TPR) repeat protein
MMLACYDTYRLAVAGGAAKHGGNRKVALQLLERARQISPDSAPVHFQLGIMYLETKEYSKARPHLEQCTRLAPDMADGWIHLSNLLATVGNRAESERVLAEGIARCPNSPGLQLEQAHRLAAAGQPEAAVAAYRESFRLRPDEAAPLFSIAKIRFEQGRDAEAVEELKRALDTEPDFPHAITVGNQADARAWLARIDLQPRVTRAERDNLLAAYREKFGAAP